LRDGTHHIRVHIGAINGIHRFGKGNYDATLYSFAS
jgi:hypothetical protein